MTTRNPNKKTPLAATAAEGNDAEGKTATAAAALLLTLPDTLLETIAARAADLVLDRLRAERSERGEPVSPWLDFKAATAYLGFSRDRLYKLTAAGAIPHRKRAGGQRLIFHRAELDQWIRHAYTPEGEAVP